LATRKIGLLGGSFNPAHEGHRHISLQALKRLRLDEVWWMVTPQNPLKSARETAPFEDRMKAAARVARHPRIRVTDIEAKLGTQHTADTLSALLPRFPKCRFVWLMGADNLQQISEWKSWTDIFRRVPIAIFSRPPYSKPALNARSVRVFADARIAESRAGSIVGVPPPAWVFLYTPPHAASATRIRARRGSATTERKGLAVAVSNR
jgi:nicotinate-nucleotide adenylyltransferase